LGLVTRALTDAGAVVKHIAPRLGVVDAQGTSVAVDATCENSPSVLFDAVILPADKASLDALASVAQASDFVKEQYRHGKAIGLLGPDAAALGRLGVEVPDGEEALAGIVDAVGDPQALIEAIAAPRHPARESDPPPV